MKRIMTLVIILTSLLIVAPHVSAGQIAYMNFEGFSMTSFSNVGSASGSPSFTWTKIATLTVSVPSTKYLGGITVDWSVKDDEGANGINTGYYAYVKIVVNGEVTKTGEMINAGLTASKLSVFKFTGIQGSTFTIDVYVEGTANDADDTITVTVNNLYVYTLDQNFAVKSELTSLTVLAPGAAGTNEGLQLNKTIVFFPQTYNLAQGTISFWLKWDGTTNLSLLKNSTGTVVGIDANSDLYVKSSTGVTYTGISLSARVGSYVPVVIAWENGNGYIMVDNQKITLNWAGNVTLEHVGDINSNSKTLIDEVRVYDVYLTPDQVSNPNTATLQLTFPNGTATVNITSDDGSNLIGLQASVYSSNMSLITTLTWGGIGTIMSATVNDSLAYVVLSGPGGSTTIIVRPGDSYTAVVPGSIAAHIQAVIEPAKYPTSDQKVWDHLLVKDAQGRVVYFNKWSFSSTPVVLMSRASYVVAVEDTNFSLVRAVYFGYSTPSIQIELPSPAGLLVYTNATAFYSVNEKAKQFRLYMYMPQGMKNVHVAVYSSDTTPILNISYPDVDLLDLKVDKLPYKFVVTYTGADGSHNSWERVLGYTSEVSPLSDIGSRTLLGMALVLGMMFAFGATSAEWAPVVTLIFAGVLAGIGFIYLPATVVTFLGAVGFFAFFSQVDLSGASLKQVAIALVLVIFAINLGVAVANYFGYLGWGTTGYSTDNTITIAGQQITFWQNYTPEYSQYGTPISSDSRNFMSFVTGLLGGTGMLLQSFGAPPVFATMFNALIWAVESALILYLLLGREV